MWQVAGGHGYIDPTSAIESMMNYHNAGFTTWDLADIYGPAENFIGDFRRKLSKQKGEQVLAEVKALTKFVPNPGIMTRPIVEQSINLSLSRMDLKTIDLLQLTMDRLAAGARGGTHRDQIVEDQIQQRLRLLPRSHQGEGRPRPGRLPTQTNHDQRRALHHARAQGDGKQDPWCRRACQATGIRGVC